MKFSMGTRWRKKATHVAIFACLAAIISQPIVGAIRNADTGGGPYNAASTSMDTQTGVYLYGNWLRACFVQANQDLSASMINGYQWFSDSGGTRSLGSVALDSADGAVKCDDANQVRIAVTVLGLGGMTPYDVLCEVGYMNYAYSRNDIKPCKGVPMSSLGVENTDKILVANTSNQPVINNDTIDITSYRLFKPYWGNADQPRLTNAIKYWLFYKTFMLACKPTVTTEPVDAFKQIIDTQVVDANGVTKTVRYQIGVGSNIDASTYIAGGDSSNPSPFSNVDFKCADLASYFSQGANRDAYASWAIAHKALAEKDQQALETTINPTGTDGSTTSGDKETCTVAGIGWIVCPLMTFVATTIDAVYALIETMLVFTVQNPFGNNPLKQIWSNVLGVANVTFVIAFLAVILSQATSIGISNYGIKKMMPRMIAAAILVNLSYYICIFAIDISNIIGAGADGILMSVLPPAQSGGLSWSTVIVGALAGIIVATSLATGALVAILAPFAGTALLAVLTTLVILIARQALLIMLIVLSPLAFVAFILPGTSEWFDKWRKTFITMLVFYPLVAILFSGSKVAAYIMQQANNGGLTGALVQVFALLVMTFPLFATPFLLKLSGSLIGRIAGVVNNPNKGPFDRLNKAGQAKADEIRKRKYEGQLDGSRRVRNPIQNAQFNMRRKRDLRRAGLEENIKNLEAADTQRRLADDAFAGSVAGNTARVPVLRARAQASMDKINAEETSAHQSSLGDRVGSAALAAGFTYRNGNLYNASGQQLGGSTGDQELRDAIGIQSPTITVAGMSALSRDVMTYGTRNNIAHDRNGARAIANVLAESNGLTAHTAQQLVESASSLTDTSGQPLQGDALRDAIQTRTYLAEHIATKAMSNPALKHLGFIGVDSNGNFDLGIKKGGIDRVVADQISAGGLASISKEMYVDDAIKPIVGQQLERRINSNDPAVVEAFDRQLTQVTEANLSNMSAALAAAGVIISTDDLRARKNTATQMYQASST